MMQLDDLDIHVLGDHVKAVHGDDVYIATLQRALAKSVRTALSTEAVLAAVRTEFLKLLRPN